MSKISESPAKIPTHIWSKFNEFMCALSVAFEESHEGASCAGYFSDSQAGQQLEELVAEAWEEVHNTLLE